MPLPPQIASKGSYLKLNWIWEQLWITNYLLDLRIGKGLRNAMLVDTRSWTRRTEYWHMASVSSTVAAWLAPGSGTTGAEP